MIWSRPEMQVLFVCTANICRSPLAEGMLRHRLRALDLANRVQVLSAGTHAAQRGCRPDPRVEEVAAEAGISLAGIRAKMLTPKMIQSSHYILVMERSQLKDVAQLRRKDPGKDNLFNYLGITNKAAINSGHPENVRLLSSFLPLSHASVEEIPDPYFGDMQGFYNVYQLIDLALTGFIQRINSHFAETGR